jgi:hypothetical protein
MGCSGDLGSSANVEKRVAPIPELRETIEALADVVLSLGYWTTLDRAAAWNPDWHLIALLSERPLQHPERDFVVVREETFHGQKIYLMVTI